MATTEAREEHRDRITSGLHDKVAMTGPGSNIHSVHEFPTIRRLVIKVAKPFEIVRATRCGV